MQGLKTVVDASQIVFGTDCPFNTAGRHITGLAKCGFTAAFIERTPQRSYPSSRVRRVLERTQAQV
jgi:hypothetical protein